MALIDKHSAQFRLICDRDGFNIAAGPFGAIQYTYRSMQQMWLFAYADRYYHRPKMMAAICKRAGISPIGKGKIKLWRGKDKGKIVEINHYYGFHSFRHFMASYLTDVEKISSKTAQFLLRHKNLSTTEGYVHFIDPNLTALMAKMEEKFAKVHPNGTPTNEKGAAE